ncbi:MAG: CdaR family protein [Erysipelotrichaceae bacterium]
MQNNNNNNNKNKTDLSKTELAKSIAKSGQKVATTYANMEAGFVRLVRYLSGVFDMVFFGKKYSKIASLVLALIIFLSLSYGNASLESYKSIQQLEKQKVTVISNSEVYEISGIPEEVKLQIIGERADIQMEMNKEKLEVVADLTGLTEGVHNVNLKVLNSSPNVEVNVEPSSAVVNISRKISKKFALSYDFINKNKMDLKYALNEAELSSNEVVVRASQETMNKIANVKALIDVQGVNADFEKEVIVVAYDEKGVKINVDIVPNVISAKVKVSSPNKTVPIVIDPIGELPAGMAIDEIIKDNASITIYGPYEVLENITRIVLPIDISDMANNTKGVIPITLPNKVNTSSITKVTFEIKFDKLVTQTIKSVPLSYRNKPNDYIFSLENPNDDKVDVVITGTQKNISAITVDNIQAYIDLANKVKGKQEIDITVEGNNPLVKFAPSKQKITITITGGTNG